MHNPPPEISGGAMFGIRRRGAGHIGAKGYPRKGTMAVSPLRNILNRSSFPTSGLNHNAKTISMRQR